MANEWQDTGAPGVGFVATVDDDVAAESSSAKGDWCERCFECHGDQYAVEVHGRTHLVREPHWRRYVRVAPNWSPHPRATALNQACVLSAHFGRAHKPARTRVLDGKGQIVARFYAGERIFEDEDDNHANIGVL